MGPGPASFYCDVCRILSAEPPLDATTHLVAHLLREIESALRDVLESGADRSERLSKKGIADDDRHEDEIRVVLKGLSISETDPVAVAWLSLADKKRHLRLAARAHRDALAPPRPIDQDFRKFLGEMEVILDNVLERFESHYLAYLRLLDDLLAKPSPTRTDAKVLRNYVPNNLFAFGYFFGKLSSPAWLEPLRVEGFFKHPPIPEYDHERGTVRFLSWPESRYLARMAALAPEVVLEIALSIPDTENVHVHEDLVDTALAMPPKLAVKLVPKVKAWLDSPYRSLLPDKLGALVTHLARGGQIDDALDLTRFLFAMSHGPRVMEKTGEDEAYHLSPEPRPRFDAWQYEQILKKIVPDLVVAGGERALMLFCDLLEDVAQLSQHRKECEEPEDYSYVWRPAIEDHSQNSPYELKSLLVSAVRDAAEQLVIGNIASVHRLVRMFEERRWRVFHRLALHLLRLFPEAAPGLIAERLTDHARFDELCLRHEYALLAQTRFPYLTSEDQAKILCFIEEGPDLTQFKSAVERQTGKCPTDEQAERYMKLWRRDRLAMLRDVLPKKWEECYEQLVAELGEPEHPEFPSWSGVWVGPTSPKTAEELRHMSVEEVALFLRSWQPSEGFMSPSYEGLGRELATLVASEPERFAVEAGWFKDLDPTYVCAFLSGLREAAKQKGKFPWSPVLDLCRWAVNEPREIAGRKGEHTAFDPSRTRKTIADLLSVGFEMDAAEIPFDLRTAAWEVLRPLTDDPDPTLEDEARYGGSNMDPATLSINTARGLAMHAVVRYAMWVRRHIEEGPDGKEHVARGFSEMPEVSDVLDRHLDLGYDRALAIRAVYGQWFPWLVLLDSHWAASNVAKIFPSEENLRDLHDAAWETYITFCRSYDSVFDILHEEYSRAVEQIGVVSREKKHFADPDEHLAKHLMAFYWRGKLNLQESGGILARFFSRAPDKLRRCALEFVGRSLYNTKDVVVPQVLDLLQALWVERINAARGVTSPTLHAAELAAFGWWFASAKFDDVWAVTQLKEALTLAGVVEPDYLVLERLATLAGATPALAVQCLDLIIEGDKEGWRILGWREHARTILACALRSTDDKARQVAFALVNRLCARGYLDFRDLLSGRKS